MPVITFSFIKLPLLIRIHNQWHLAHNIQSPLYEVYVAIKFMIINLEPLSTRYLYRGQGGGRGAIEGMDLK